MHGGLPTPNPVAVDERRGNGREVAVGDETESLDADTTEVKEHVSLGAENVTEEAANSDTVEQLPETAAGAGTTGSGAIRLTRSGRQSRMRQCPDFEYY